MIDGRLNTWTQEDFDRGIMITVPHHKWWVNFEDWTSHHLEIERKRQSLRFALHCIGVRYCENVAHQYDSRFFAIYMSNLFTKNKVPCFTERDDNYIEDAIHINFDQLFPSYDTDYQTLFEWKYTGKYSNGEMKPVLVTPKPPSFFKWMLGARG